VCDLETSRIGAPYIYIYDISSLRVKFILHVHRKHTHTHTHTHRGNVLVLLERGIQKTQLTEMPLLGGVNHCNALFNTITYIKGNTVCCFSNVLRCGVQYRTNNALCIYTNGYGTATSHCSNTLSSHCICRNIQYKQI